MRWKACRSRCRPWPTPWERSARRLIRCLRLVEAHVMAAERLHGDDTTVPVLALGKTDTGRCWIYVRDDRPFGGSDPPAAMFYYSRDRRGEHPQAHLASYAGILQADAFDGYNKLYRAPAKSWADPGGGLLGPCPAPVLRHGGSRGERATQGCWQEGDRPLADRDRDRAPHRRAVRDRAHPSMAKAPRNERLSARRRARRWSTIWKPICASSAPSSPAGTIWPRRSTTCSSAGRSFTRFLDDGRVCLSNNAAERALRGIALGRKSWLFCGSDRGGRRAAAMYSLIVSAKMNDVDPQAWLADVLARIATHPAHRLDELLPWNWKTAQQQGLAAQAA